MEDHYEDLEIQESSASHTISAASSSGSPKFPLMLKTVVCSPAVLLILSLTTSTINILIYTSIFFEWLAFFLLLSSICIFSSLTVTPLIFFIEIYYIMKNIKIFYIFFALRTSLRFFFCSSSLLFSWYVLIKPDMNINVHHLVTNTLATSVIAAVMWTLKIVILKELDCHFHDKNFLQNIRDLISNEYVLQTLLGFSIGSTDPNDTTWRPHLKYIERAFNIMLLLFGCTKLRTICDELENTDSDNDHKVERYISLVFKNIIIDEHSDVQEPHLLSVMKKDDIEDFLRLFDGAAETKRISQESFRNWMIKVCNEREHLVKLLNRTSKVIEQLNINVFVIQSILVVLVWCLLMGVGTTNPLVFFSIPLLVFGYYCKIIYDGAMLAIVAHPFDIEDHCTIDNEQLVVKKIGLIKTDFLKEDGKKLEFPNSVLLTKSVSNLNRSPELTDTVEILVSTKTSSDKIAALKLKIDDLIKSKPENWRAVGENPFKYKGADDGKDIYILKITDVRKFQNYETKEDRRCELNLKMKEFLDDLDITYLAIK